LTWHHWFRRNAIVPVFELLRQGVTPEKLALSLAIGMALGCAPILGVTTILAFGICYATRLNPVAMQLTNYLMYPAQIILFIPFIRVGEILFRARRLRISTAQVESLFHSSPANAMHLLWTAIWHALIVWLIVAPVAVGIMYAIFTPILRHAAARFAPEEGADGAGLRGKWGLGRSR
jgi:uncharacterized protein (DUF2062 family)